MTEKRPPLKPWTAPLCRRPVNIHPGVGNGVVITWDDQQDTAYPSLEDAVSYLKSIGREYIIHDV